MKKVLVFAGSNSKDSINKKFVKYVADQFEGIEKNIIDLNDYEIPIYSVDLEKEIGIHKNVLAFHKLIKDTDAIIVSIPEHNGLHPAVFKNLWDWLSRIELGNIANVWGSKCMFLLSTSVSKREQSNMMKISKEIFPHFGANIVADFYLPSFEYFFKDNKIIEEKYIEMFKEEKNKFQNFLDN